MYDEYQVSFVGVEQLGCGIDNLPSCSTKLKERVELYLLPLWGYTACRIMKFSLIDVCYH